MQIIEKVLAAVGLITTLGCASYPDSRAYTDLVPGDCFETKNELFVVEKGFGLLEKRNNIFASTFYSTHIAPINVECIYINSKDKNYVNDVVVDVRDRPGCGGTNWYMILNKGKRLYINSVYVREQPLGTLRYYLYADFPEYGLDRVKLSFPLFDYYQEKNVISTNEKYLKKCV